MRYMKSLTPLPRNMDGRLRRRERIEAATPAARDRKMTLGPTFRSRASARVAQWRSCNDQNKRVRSTQHERGRGAMQVARARRGVTLLTAMLVALFAVGNAYADTRVIADRNDRPGPLDIRSASHAHDGARVVHTISTFSRWRLGVIGRTTSNLFAVEISTDGDPALERVVLVFSANGRPVAQVFRLPTGTLVGSASVSRPNGRTVRISIPRSRLGNPSGYRWNAHSQYKAAGACSGFCSDRAPNSSRVLHDITAPRITFPAPPVPGSTEYDVTFTISDAGGSSLSSWRLEHRAFGETAWSTVESGTTIGSKSHHHVAAEDADDEYRVVALDRQGNTSVSPIRLVSVPIDDTNPSLIYSGTWTHGPGDPLDFRETLSTSMDVCCTLSTVAITFTGRYVAWVAPGATEDDYATVSTEGIPSAPVFLDLFNGRRNIVFEHTFATVGTRTLTIQAITGAIPIDGIIVR